MPKSLRNNLKAYRTQHKLTQAELAAMIGVSRKTINTVENGIFVPSVIIALQLARVLNTSVEELFELTA